MNLIQSNPQLRRLDQLQFARKQHSESEWRLNFLRAIEAEPPKPLTDEELCQTFAQTSSASSN